MSSANGAAGKTPEHPTLEEELEESSVTDLRNGEQNQLPWMGDEQNITPSKDEYAEEWVLSYQAISHFK